MKLGIPRLAGLLLVAWTLGSCGAQGDAPSATGSGTPVPALKVPPGFHIAIWAEGLHGPRSLALGPNGTVFVGNRLKGIVVALADRDGDGRAEVGHVVARGLDGPNGVAVLDKDLYVGERSRIIRFDDIEAHLEAPPAPVVVREGMPSGGGHGFRYLAFGPDRRLYVGLGAPCNVCEATSFEGGIESASLTRMDADGSHWELVARGVRNTVGFAWHPKTGALWFTDNGRDHLGDDRPSCELNQLTAIGQHFGFPYCHQGDIEDPEFGKGHPCSDFVPPAVKLGPHVAPLGIRFYTGTQFPAAVRGAAIVAEHGSWNRSHKIGYRVVAVHVDAAGGPTQEVLVDGWLEDEKVSGRPVDVLQLPDGSLLISDDAAGRIWRLSHAGPAGA